LWAPAACLVALQGRAHGNRRGGVAYLRWARAYFAGEISLVAAAYNAGERSVERYRGVPPYEETRA
jgi:soluble lytic murein transglycosylase-like protein